MTRVHLKNLHNMSCDLCHKKYFSLPFFNHILVIIIHFISIESLKPQCSSCENLPYHGKGTSEPCKKIYSFMNYNWIVHFMSMFKKMGVTVKRLSNGSV